MPNLDQSKTQNPEFITKILIVDDLPGNLLALEGLLRRKDLEIYEAQSGTEALELIMSNEFALALIDVQMPQMSGFELAELIRGSSISKGIPLIFVTATAIDQKFLFRGYESGAVDYLSKPLDPHSVQSKVNIFVELYQRQKAQKLLLLKLTKTQLELEETLRMKDEFMSIASHELKTPLTSLKLQSQLRKMSLLKSNLSEFTHDKLLAMFTSDEKQLDRFTKLIDDMLDHARMGSGKLSMKMVQLDLGDLVSEAVKRTSLQLKAAGCEVRVEMTEPVIGKWDQFSLEQVVTNLLTNSIRYAAHKPILIRLSKLNGQAQILFTDQGCGIDLQDQSRIFERFERIVSGVDQGGLGLGLYIVKQIIDAHQGTISLESELGKGATFIINLPLE